MARKRVWRKNLSRVEIWNSKRFRVTRNPKGHFVTWHRIRHYYRKSAKAQYRNQWRTTARRGSSPLFIPQKQIAVYGTVGGQSRRIQMSGSGQELYKALRDASQHPPKEKFLTANAGEIITKRDRLIDERLRWDRRPEIESR